MARPMSRSGDDSVTNRPLPQVAGVEHRFVEANGIRMHIAEAGSPNDDPLFLVHGWPQHWWEWRELIPPLAEHYRVICPDLRGLGWSEAPAHGYEKESLADDILALLDELGLERVRFVGHDWGGFIGFLISLREPGRIERHLALNVAPPFVPVNVRNALAAWHFWYQWVIASPFGARAVSNLGSVGGAAVRWVGSDAWGDTEREVFFSQFREPARAGASVGYYRAFVLRDFPAIVRGRYRGRQLRVPTRIVFGTEDRAIPSRWLAGCERRGDDLEIELVEGVGHFIVDQRPELVLDRAFSFFRK